MKILHIGKYYPPFHGGIENFLDDLVREQAGQGHEVKVICHQHERGRPTETEPVDSGPEIIRAAILGVAAYAPVAPGFYRALRDVLNEFRPDVVHVHMPNASAFWLLLTKNDFKLVIHWHSDVVSSENDWKLKTLYPFYRIWETRLLARADNVIATSRPYLDTSIPLRRFKHKCRVIPLGINPSRLESFKKTLRVSARISEVFILSAGRFTYYKGYEYLIRACTLGYKGRLVIAGGGPLMPDLERLVRRLRLSDRVFMPGKLSNFDLHQYFQGCRAFCLPSIERTEAFGMVLLEAMFYGKPLITTRIEGSGMNEVNIHEQTGLVVSPEDPDALARAMSFMLEKTEKAEEMGLRGRRRLLEQFVMVRVAREVDGVY